MLSARVVAGFPSIILPDSGLGIEGMLQDSFPSQIPAQGREVFRWI